METELLALLMFIVPFLIAVGIAILLIIYWIIIGIQKILK